jgi:cell division protein FtsI/penicillin-binding protein 2
LGVLLCIAFAGLGYRLVDLQVLRHKELSAKAQKNTQRELVFEPRRGDILDVNGNILATSLMVKNVCADPTFIGTNQLEVARALAPLLQTNENALVSLLTPTLRRGTNSAGLTNTFNRYVCLSKHVPVETWEKIYSTMTNLTLAGEDRKLPIARRAYYEVVRQKAIFAVSEQVRSYPNQSLASHVLGFTAVLENKQPDEPAIRDIVGKAGIEQSFNAKLAGMRGWRLTETDGREREVVALRAQDVEAEDGLNVVLTLDSVIQHIVETALADALGKYSPLNISGIVVRPATGEILAMATLPDFNPNEMTRVSIDSLLNKTISLVAEPGSTFKIVVVSAALNEGLIRLTDLFDCEHGAWYYGGRRLRDHEPYGILSAEQIITKSSNIGAAKIGLRLGEDRLAEYIHKFGFGQNTGLPLPAEVHGLVHPVKDWKKVSLAQIPMGQGIAVTRLQMIMAMSAIANKGTLMRPMLVNRLEDRDGRAKVRYSPQSVRQVISESTVRQMVQALKTVVTPEGTAAKAALEHYTVAGKTGTAQKIENGVYVNKYFSSFIGFFPADDPKLCISITLDDPKQGHYGGLVAGPVFKQIAEAAANYLNIRPEDSDEPSPRPAPIAASFDPPPLKTDTARSQ